MHANSHAGCCYLCGNYVAIGGGELLKNRVAGHRYSLRCLPCGLSAPKPSAAPTEAVLNDPATTLLRQAVRDNIRRLLREDDMPVEKRRPGQLWLEQPGHSLEDLHRVKNQLIQLLATEREKRERLAA